MIRVTVWNEFRHEKASKEVAAIYPNGLHATIAEFLGKNDDIECRLACLDDPEHGLTDDVLDNTDVLIWWGRGSWGRPRTSAAVAASTVIGKARRYCRCCWPEPWCWLGCSCCR